MSLLALFVWQIKKHEQLGLIGTVRRDASAITAIAFDPSATLLATGDCAGVVRVWDLSSAREQGSFQASRVKVDSVVWSPNGNYLICVCVDGSISVWDVIGQKKLYTKADCGSSTAIFSPDSSFIVSGNWDATISLYHIITGDEFAILSQEDNQPVVALGFSPNGNLLLSATILGEITIWSADELQFIQKVAGSRGLSSECRNTFLVLSKDGSRVVSACDGPIIRVWEPVTWQEQGGILDDIPPGNTLGITVVRDGSIISVASAPDCHILLGACGDGSLRVWDLQTYERVYLARLEPLSVAISSDGKTLATGHDNGCVKIWDLATFLSRK